MENSIYFWRILALFSLLNLINLIAVDDGSGMKAVWVALIGMSLILSFKVPFQWFFSNKYIKGSFWICVLIFFVVESMIIFQSLQFSVPQNSDYLIVLGARVRGDTPSLALQARLDVAYDYLIKNPHTKAILTGGKGTGENITEAEAMNRYLLQKGIPADRLLLEDKATDTVENLIYSLEMIDPSLQNPQITLATSKFHILRSKIIAHKLGWKVDGIGSDTLPFLIPTYYLREFFAVVAEVIF